MSTYTITGNDTLTLNDRVFNDLAYDDVTTISFPNALVGRKTGKNGNTMFAQNAQGFNGDLVIRVARGSSDDQFLQGLIAISPTDFPSLVLLFGSFIKRLGDGKGAVISDSYQLNAGVISKIPDAKESTSGDTDQAISMYTVLFANCQRLIG